MPTYKQVVNHVKKHVLWKDEYFERYYRLNPELVQKRLDKIYQAEDDLMVLISTQLFCFLQANDALYFDGCYKTGKVAVDGILKDFEAVDSFHGEHPGVMYSHRKRLIRKMRVVV